MMTTTKRKLSFLSITLGSLTLGALSIGSTFAGPIDWAKCKYCNARSKKCATDDKFFEGCMTKCPQSKNSDPLKKCRDAHFKAVKPKANEPQASLSDVVAGTCKEKQALITMHNLVAAKHRKPAYTQAEKDYILGGCDKEEGTTASTATGPADIPPPSDLPPKFTGTSTSADVPHPADLPPKLPTDVQRKYQGSKPLPPTPPQRRASAAQSVPQPEAAPEETPEPTEFQKALMERKKGLRQSGSSPAVGSSTGGSDYQPMPAPRKSGTLSPSSSGSKIPTPPQGGPKATPSVAPAQASTDVPGRAGLLSDLNTDSPMARLRKMDPNAPKPAPKRAPVKAPTEEEESNQSMAEVLKKAMDARRNSMHGLLGEKELTPEEKAAKAAQEKEWE